MSFDRKAMKLIFVQITQNQALGQKKTHTKRIFPNDVNNGNKFDTKYLFTVYIKEIQYFRFVTNTFCASRKLTVFLLFENKLEKKFE